MSPGRASARAKLIRSRAGERHHALLGPVADPPPRHVQHPAQRHLVVGVGDQPQVGEQVADLAPLVEPDPADHLVRQPGPDEDLLEHPGLSVGPVEHRHLPGGRLALVGEPVHLLGHERGLVVLAVGHVTGDRRPVARLGPELLGHPAGVAGDDGVGRGQDVLGGAVVLLEQDHLGAGEVALELLDVPDRGAAEGVDRLVGVAHHAQLGRRARLAGSPPRSAPGSCCPASSVTRTYWAWLVSWYSSTSTCRNLARYSAATSGNACSRLTVTMIRSSKSIAPAATSRRWYSA